jgi:hypothetical protein
MSTAGAPEASCASCRSWHTCPEQWACELWLPFCSFQAAAIASSRMALSFSFVGSFGIELLAVEPGRVMRP